MMSKEIKLGLNLLLRNYSSALGIFIKKSRQASAQSSLLNDSIKFAIIIVQMRLERSFSERAKKKTM